MGAVKTDPTPIIRAARDAGFGALLLTLGGAYPDADLADAVRREGLKIDNSHAPWHNINALWLEGGEGDAVERMLTAHLESCAACGVPRAVWHVSSGNDYPPISQTGMDRVCRMVERAEALGVDIALENQRFFHFIDYIYAKIGSERLKFCYDSGHEACFSQTKVALPKYRSRLAALHLHDNDGGYNHDQHMMPGTSCGVDWDYVRRYIADYDGVISLEVKRIPDISWEEFFDIAIKAARFVKS